MKKGFNRGKNLKKVGVKANDTAELFFDNLRVPKSAILGGPDCLNQGFGFLMNELARLVTRKSSYTNKFKRATDDRSSMRSRSRRNF